MSPSSPVLSSAEQPPLATSHGGGRGSCVLLVEDNPGDAVLSALALAGHGIGTRHVGSLAEALAAAGGEECFDAVLLDLGLPESTGLETLERWREAAPRDLPVIVLTGDSREESGIAAVRAGADDFIWKGELDAMPLRRVLRYAMERARMRAALERTALLDPLTDAYNRRGFQMAATQQAERADRTAERCLVFYADLVGLKAANDAFGHDAGDLLIRGAADVLRSISRGSDVVGRLGGDEFAIWMSGASLACVEAVASRLEHAAAVWNAGAAPRHPLRFAWGAAERAPHEPLTSVLDRADRDLLRRRPDRRSAPLPMAG